MRPFRFEATLDTQRSASADRIALGIGLTLAAMFGFAVMDAISKVLGQHLSVPQILWVRYILYTLLAVAVLRPMGLRRVFHSQRPWLQLSRSLLIIIENGVFVYAFTLMPLADMHAIAAASPLLVIALSVPLLGEKVGWRRWMAVIAGFAGVLLIVRPGLKALDWPMLVALAGALLWGVYQVLVRMCSRTDSSETTWLWTAVVGLLATSIVGPATWVWPDGWGWAMLFAIAALGTGCHWAFIKALSLVEASAVQPYSYTLFVWAALIGWLWFGDVPDGRTLAGATVIIASGLYAWHRERVRAGQRVSG